MTDVLFINTHEPPPKHLSFLDRLRRVQALIGSLRDTLEVAGQEYSPHFGKCTWICDFIDDELDEIAHGLRT